MHKSTFLCLVILCGLYSACSKETPNQETHEQAIKEAQSYLPLTLISCHQMKTFDDRVFDCSGIAERNDSIFVIADKPWNTFIYQIDFEGKSWEVVNTIPIDTKERLDLEGIEVHNGSFYLSNESSGEILKMKDGNLTIEAIDFESINQKPSGWGNAGWEGLAIDTKNDILYLVKERQPRMIFVYDMKSKKFIDEFDIPQTECMDFADAKFLDGHLYILERNGNYVTKIKPETHAVVSKYHYRHVASHPDGKLYGPSKYGMAESLLITENEIWIGLDNNGKEVTEYALKTFELSGNAPLFLKFKRPPGF